jgi:4-amino-4-deoxy-L-arabinose transferase-like glycosyltransferase
MSASAEQLRQRPTHLSVVPTNSPLGLPRWAVISTLIICLLAASFLCFWRLGEREIDTTDEYLHISVMQDMFHNGNWFHPIFDGEPYFNKPPLKMWATLLPLHLFGESTFSFRFPDALAGVVTALLVAIVCLFEFRSAAAALLGVAAFLGCELMMFVHGFRMANQDAWLVMFNQLGLIFGYLAITPNLNRSTKERRRAALLGGLAVGCGIFVKSAGALMVYIVLGVYAALLFLPLLRPNKKNIITHIKRIDWKILALATIPALVIPSLYFVPHFIYTPNAFETVVMKEVVTRVTVGYHRVSDTWFYLREQFVARKGMPPELLCFSILAGIVLWRKNRQPALLLLVCATVVPFVFYNLIHSRGSWYVSTMHPPAAALIGVTVTSVALALLKRIQAANTETQRNVCGILFASVTGISVALLALNVNKVYSQIRHMREPSYISTVVDSMLEHAKAHPEFRVYVLKGERIARSNRPHIRRLKNQVVFGLREAEIEKLLREGNSEVVLIGSRSRVAPFYQVKPVTGSTIVPVVLTPTGTDQKHDFWVLSFSPTLKTHVLGSAPAPS